MGTLVLLAASVFFAVQWLACWAAAAGLVKYMAKKGYTPPSEQETETCIREVLLEIFHRWL